MTESPRSSSHEDSRLVDDPSVEGLSCSESDQSPFVQARVIILNHLGLHARPAMSFVDVANTFTSEIRVRKDSQEVDGKSIMQMMMLAATKGTELLLLAQGPDAQDAVDALGELVSRKFDEEE